MSWNYRIIDHGDHLALHEVHYDMEGRPKSYTAGPATFIADAEDGLDDLRGSIAAALSDAIRHPVLLLTDFRQPVQVFTATSAPGLNVSVVRDDSPEAVDITGDTGVRITGTVETGPIADIVPESLKVRLFDPVNYLRDPLDARAYLEAAMEEDAGQDNDRHLLGALQDIIRSGALEKPRIKGEPEINIVWSDEDKAWLATAVVDGRPVPQSTADGKTPVLALDALMEKRFLIGSDLF